MEIQYIDNGFIKGWFCVNSYFEVYGDGTFEDAQRIYDIHVKCELEEEAEN